MPDGNEVLRIGAQFDVGALQTGLSEGAAAVSTSTQQMGDDFEALKAHSAAAEASIAESMRGSSREVMEARHAIHGLGEEIGVSVPRFVQSFVTSIGGVAPVMAAAFSAVAIIGIVQILAEIPDAIDKIIGKLSGWDDAAKKAYQDMVAGNLEAIKANLKYQDDLNKTKEIGTTGLEKLAIAQSNLTASQKATAAASYQLQMQEQSQQAEIDALKSKYTEWKNVLMDPFTLPDALKDSIHQVGKEIEDKNQSLEQFKKTVATFTETLQHADSVQAAQLSAEKIAEARDQAQQLARIQIEGQEAFNRAKAEGFAQEQAFNAKMAGGGYVSPDQEATLATQKENAVYGVDRDGLERRLALAKSEGEKGVEQAAQIAQQLEALAATHQNKLDAIAQSAAEKDLELLNRESMDMAQQFAEMQTKQTAQRIQATVDSVKQIEEKGRAELEQLRANASEQERAIAGMSAYKGADPGITKVAGTALDDEKTKISELITAEQQLQQYLAANNVLKTDPRVQESIEREAQLQKALTEATKSYNMTLTDVAKAQMQTFDQAFSRITGTFNQNVIQWINGSERFSQLAQRAWTNLADTAISSALKMGERFVQQQIIMRTQSQITASSQAASAAQGAAIVQASQLRQQLAFAKSAAGGAYNAMVGIPIIGPELGAVAAATTFAAIMAFDKGGIMPKDDIAMLHKNEMVLPPNISQTVQTMAANGGAATQGHTFNYSPTIHGSSEQSARDLLDNHGKMFVDYAMRQLRRMNYT